MGQSQPVGANLVYRESGNSNSQPLRFSGSQSYGQSHPMRSATSKSPATRTIGGKTEQLDDNDYSLSVSDLN